MRLRWTVATVVTSVLVAACSPEVIQSLYPSGNPSGYPIYYQSN